MAVVKEAAYQRPGQVKNGSVFNIGSSLWRDVKPGDLSSLLRSFEHLLFNFPWYIIPHALLEHKVLCNTPGR